MHSVSQGAPRTCSAELMCPFSWDTEDAVLGGIPVRMCVDAVTL